MVKDKNKPKGPMSAYACFVQVIREEHKKKHPEESVVFSEFSKKCAEKWKTMTEKEKQRFDDMASRDKERYIREMDTYVPPDGLKKPRKRRRNKDPGQPKRALSAFFFFCEEKRPAVRAEHPEWKVGDIAKDLGRQWELCQCKAKYENQAMADKSRYEREMIEYRNGTFVMTKRARMEDGEALLAAGNGNGSMAMYNTGDVTAQPQVSQSYMKPDDPTTEVPGFDSQMKPELSASGANYRSNNDAVPHPAATFGHPTFSSTTASTQQSHQPLQPQAFGGMMPQDLTTPTQSQFQNSVLDTQQAPSQTNVPHDIPVAQHRVTPGGDTVDMTSEQNGGPVNAARISEDCNDLSRNGTNAADDDENEDDEEEDEDVADE